MKKIICLVLALVMSLSFMTISFADETTTDTADTTPPVSTDTDISGKDESIPESTPFEGTTYDIYSAINGQFINPIVLQSMPWINNTDGSGQIAHFIDANDICYVITNDTEDADYVLKYTNSKTVFKYVKVVDEVIYESKATEFTNFGVKCGQINKTVSTAKYYTWTYKEAIYYGEAVEIGATDYVLVNNEIIGVALVDVNRHNFYVATRVDGVATEIKCAICGINGIPVKNAISVPNGKDYITMSDLGGNYSGVYFDKFNTITTIDKKPVQDAIIESPQTGDMGILGYVLTSLFATTGLVGFKKRK